MTFGAGCAAEVDAESQPGGAYPASADDEAIVYIDTVPPNIEAYPRYAYGDGYAYYVEGRWYHRGPRGWGYYRQEPPQLARQRQSGVQEAPRERSQEVRANAAPQRAQEPQAPAGSRPQEQREPAASRPEERQAAPAAGRPPRGVVEAQPTSGGAVRRAPPPGKRAAPPKQHDR